MGEDLAAAGCVTRGGPAFIQPHPYLELFLLFLLVKWWADFDSRAKLAKLAAAAGKVMEGKVDGGRAGGVIE